MATAVASQANSATSQPRIPDPGGYPEPAEPLGCSAEPKESGQSPDVEVAQGHRGSSWFLTSARSHPPWPRPPLLPAAWGHAAAFSQAALTLGSTRRGVLRFMKDFTLL